MRKQASIILTIITLVLIFVTILIMQVFRSDEQMNRIKNEIEQRSGRKIRISSLSNMYYQAIRKGDDVEFVHKVISNQTRVRTGITTKKGAIYKYEEYAFDEDVATVYLYIKYDEDEKVSYIALQ